jgi:outer membrane immunogenic protein
LAVAGGVATVLGAGMRKLFIASVCGLAALAAGAGANAADMVVKAPPPPAIYDWSGGYVGLNAGIDWGSSTISPYESLVFPVYAFSVPGVGIVAVPAQFATLPSANGSAASIIGGGQAGYNWQSGHFVYGLEGDIDGTGLREKSASTLSRTFFGNTQTVTANFSANIDWIATVRARLGYAMDRSLFYVTGGLAVAGTSVDTAYSITVPVPAFPALAPMPLSASSSQVVAGWTLGAGGEWAIDRKWSVGLEYRHSDFGSHGYNLGYTDASLVGLPGIGPNTAAVRFTEDQVTARLNYHFH